MVLFYKDVGYYHSRRSSGQLNDLFLTKSHLLESSKKKRHFDLFFKIIGVWLFFFCDYFYVISLFQLLFCLYMFKFKKRRKKKKQEIHHTLFYMRTGSETVVLFLNQGTKYPRLLLLK